KKLNLLNKSQIKEMKDFDIVFCKNVYRHIYPWDFDVFDTIIADLTPCIKDYGYLVVSHDTDDIHKSFYPNQVYEEVYPYRIKLIEASIYQRLPSGNSVFSLDGGNNNFWENSDAFPADLEQRPKERIEIEADLLIGDEEISIMPDSLVIDEVTKKALKRIGRYAANLSSSLQLIPIGISNTMKPVAKIIKGRIWFNLQALRVRPQFLKGVAFYVIFCQYCLGLNAEEAKDRALTYFLNHPEILSNTIQVLEKNILGVQGKECLSILREEQKRDFCDSLFIYDSESKSKTLIIYINLLRKTKLTDEQDHLLNYLLSTARVMGNSVSDLNRALKKPKAKKLSRRRIQRYNYVLRESVRRTNHNILGALELLKDTVLSEEQGKLLRKAEIVAEAIDELVDKVTKLIKLESLDLDKTLSSVINNLSWDLKQNNISWEYSRALGEMIVYADASLEKVFATLIHNAMIHSSCNKIDIVVEDIKEKDIYKVSIIDNGKGIPNIKKQGFFLKKSKSLGPEGRDLSPASIREIIESYNGEIEVVDRVGESYSRGTCFYIYLPKGRRMSGLFEEVLVPEKVNDFNFALDGGSLTVNRASLEGDIQFVKEELESLNTSIDGSGWVNLNKAIESKDLEKGLQSYINSNSIIFSSDVIKIWDSNHSIRNLLRDADVVILGEPDDKGTVKNLGRPGARLGPEAVIGQLLSALPDIQEQIKDLKIVYLGDIKVTDNILDTHLNVKAVIAEVVKINPNITLICIGGDHGFAYPNFYSFDGNKGIVVADAHLEVRSPRDDRKSGRGPGAHSGNHIYFTLTDKRANLSAAHLYYLGINPAAHEHYKRRINFLRRRGFELTNLYSLEELQHKNQAEIDTLIDNIYHQLQDRGIDTIHTSICIDVVNREEAPGRSARNAEGLPVWMIERLSYKAGQNPSVRLFDIAEVSPPLDKDNKTSKIASKYIVEFLRGFSGRKTIMQSENYATDGGTKDKIKQSRLDDFVRVSNDKTSCLEKIEFVDRELQEATEKLYNKPWSSALEDEVSDVFRYSKEYMNLIKKRLGKPNFIDIGKEANIIKEEILFLEGLLNVYNERKIVNPAIFGCVLFKLLFYFNTYRQYFQEPEFKNIILPSIMRFEYLAKMANPEETLMYAEDACKKLLKCIRNHPKLASLEDIKYQIKNLEVLIKNLKVNLKLPDEFGFSIRQLCLNPAEIRIKERLRRVESLINDLESQTNSNFLIRYISDNKETLDLAGGGNSAGKFYLEDEIRKVLNAFPYSKNWYTIDAKLQAATEKLYSRPWESASSDEIEKIMRLFSQWRELVEERFMLITSAFLDNKEKSIKAQLLLLKELLNIYLRRPIVNYAVASKLLGLISHCIKQYPQWIDEAGLSEPAEIFVKRCRRFNFKVNPEERLTYLKENIEKLWEDCQINGIKSNLEKFKADSIAFRKRLERIKADFRFPDKYVLCAQQRQTTGAEDRVEQLLQKIESLLRNLKNEIEKLDSQFESTEKKEANKDNPGLQVSWEYNDNGILFDGGKAISLDKWDLIANSRDLVYEVIFKTRDAKGEIQQISMTIRRDTRFNKAFAARILHLGETEFIALKMPVSEEIVDKENLIYRGVYSRKPIFPFALKNLRPLLLEMFKAKGFFFKEEDIEIEGIVQKEGLKGKEVVIELPPKIFRHFAALPLAKFIARGMNYYISMNSAFDKEEELRRQQEHLRPEKLEQIKKEKELICDYLISIMQIIRDSEGRIVAEWGHLDEQEREEIDGLWKTYFPAMATRSAQRELSIQITMNFKRFFGHREPLREEHAKTFASFLNTDTLIIAMNTYPEFTARDLLKLVSRAIEIDEGVKKPLVSTEFLGPVKETIEETKQVKKPSSLEELKSFFTGKDENDFINLCNLLNHWYRNGEVGLAGAFENKNSLFGKIRKWYVEHIEDKGVIWEDFVQMVSVEARLDSKLIKKYGCSLSEKEKTKFLGIIRYIRNCYLQEDVYGWTVSSNPKKRLAQRWLSEHIDYENRVGFLKDIFGEVPEPKDWSKTAPSGYWEFCFVDYLNARNKNRDDMYSWHYSEDHKKRSAENWYRQHYKGKSWIVFLTEIFGYPPEPKDWNESAPIGYWEVVLDIKGEKSTALDKFIKNCAGRNEDMYGWKYSKDPKKCSALTYFGQKIGGEWKDYLFKILGRLPEHKDFSALPFNKWPYTPEQIIKHALLNGEDMSGKAWKKSEDLIKRRVYSWYKQNKMSEFKSWNNYIYSLRRSLLDNEFSLYPDGKTAGKIEARNNQNTIMLDGGQIKRSEAILATIKDLIEKGAFHEKRVLVIRTREQLLNELAEQGYKIEMSTLEGYITKIHSKTREQWNNNKHYIDKLRDSILSLLGHMVRGEDRIRIRKEIFEEIAKATGLKYNLLYWRFVPTSDYYKALVSKEAGTDLSRKLKIWIDWLNDNWGEIKKSELPKEQDWILQGKQFIIAALEKKKSKEEIWEEGRRNVITALTRIEKRENITKAFFQDEDNLGMAIEMIAKRLRKSSASAFKGDEVGRHIYRIASSKFKNLESWAEIIDYFKKKGLDIPAVPEKSLPKQKGAEFRKYKVRVNIIEKLRENNKDIDIHKAKGILKIVSEDKQRLEQKVYEVQEVMQLISEEKLNRFPTGYLMQMENLAVAIILRALELKTFSSSVLQKDTLGSVFYQAFRRNFPNLDWPLWRNLILYEVPQLAEAIGELVHKQKANLLDFVKTGPQLNRQKIAEQLNAKEPISINKIAKQLKLSRATVSQHIKFMKNQKEKGVDWLNVNFELLKKGPRIKEGMAYSFCCSFCGSPGLPIIKKRGIVLIECPRCKVTYRYNKENAEFEQVQDVTNLLIELERNKHIKTSIDGETRGIIGRFSCPVCGGIGTFLVKMNGCILIECSRCKVPYQYIETRGFEPIPVMTSLFCKNCHKLIAAPIVRASGYSFRMCSNFKICKTVYTHTEENSVYITTDDNNHRMSSNNSRSTSVNDYSISASSNDTDDSTATDGGTVSRKRIATKSGQKKPARMHMHTESRERLLRDVSYYLVRSHVAAKRQAMIERAKKRIEAAFLGYFDVVDEDFTRRLEDIGFGFIEARLELEEIGPFQKRPMSRFARDIVFRVILDLLKNKQFKQVIMIMKKSLNMYSDFREWAEVILEEKGYSLRVSWSNFITIREARKETAQETTQETTQELPVVPGIKKAEIITYPEQELAMIEAIKREKQNLPVLFDRGKTELLVIEELKGTFGERSPPRESEESKQPQEEKVRLKDLRSRFLRYLHKVFRPAPVEQPKEEVIKEKSALEVPLTKEKPAEKEEQKPTPQKISFSKPTQEIIEKEKITDYERIILLRQIRVYLIAGYLDVANWKMNEARSRYYGILDEDMQKILSKIGFEFDTYTGKFARKKIQNPGGGLAFDGGKRENFKVQDLLEISSQRPRCPECGERLLLFELIEDRPFIKCENCGIFKVVHRNEEYLQVRILARFGKKYGYPKAIRALIYPQEKNYFDGGKEESLSKNHQYTKKQAQEIINNFFKGKEEELAGDFIQWLKKKSSLRAIIVNKLIEETGVRNVLYLSAAHFVNNKLAYFLEEVYGNALWKMRNDVVNKIDALVCPHCNERITQPTMIEGSLYHICGQNHQIYYARLVQIKYFIIRSLPKEYWKLLKELKKGKISRVEMEGWIIQNKIRYPLITEINKRFGGFLRHKDYRNYSDLLEKVGLTQEDEILKETPWLVRQVQWEKEDFKIRVQAVKWLMGRVLFKYEYYFLLLNGVNKITTDIYLTDLEEYILKHNLFYPGYDDFVKYRLAGLYEVYRDLEALYKDTLKDDPIVKQECWLVIKYNEWTDKKEKQVIKRVWLKYLPVEYKNKVKEYQDGKINLRTLVDFVIENKIRTSGTQLFKWGLRVVIDNHRKHLYYALLFAGIEDPVFEALPHLMIEKMPSGWWEEDDNKLLAWENVAKILGYPSLRTLRDAALEDKGVTDLLAKYRLEHSWHKKGLVNTLTDLVAAENEKLINSLADIFQEGMMAKRILGYKQNRQTIREIATLDSQLVEEAIRRIPGTDFVFQCLRNSVRLIRLHIPVNASALAYSEEDISRIQTKQLFLEKEFGIDLEDNPVLLNLTEEEILKRAETLKNYGIKVDAYALGLTQEAIERRLIKEDIENAAGLYRDMRSAIRPSYIYEVRGVAVNKVALNRIEKLIEIALPEVKRVLAQFMQSPYQKDVREFRGLRLPYEGDEEFMRRQKIAEKLFNNLGPKDMLDGGKKEISRIIVFESLFGWYQRGFYFLKEIIRYFELISKKFNALNNRPLVTQHIPAGQMMSLKRIGILTGGGPASGHNEVIYSAVKEAQAQGIEVVKIPEGWSGLTKEKLVTQVNPIYLKDIELQRNKGGTVLVTSRENPYSKDNIVKGVPKILWENIQKLNLDGLITLGGDDTNSVSYQLQKDHPDFLIVGLPKTMDNDIALPEPEAQTYGFDSFVKAATPAVSNGIIDAIATKRVLIVEVFGRSAGFVAARIGATVCASRTLIPEEEVDLEQLVNDLIRYHKQNKYAVVVVSEGIKIRRNYKNNAAILDAAFTQDALAKAAYESAEKAVKDAFGNPKLENAGLIINAILKAGLKEAKIKTSLAGKVDYLFRSADTSALDMQMCSLLGQAAVRGIVERKNNQMLYVYNNTVKSMPLTEKLGGRKFDYQGKDRKEYLRANLALTQEIKQEGILDTPAPVKNIQGADTDNDGQTVTDGGAVARKPVEAKSEQRKYGKISIYPERRECLLRDASYGKLILLLIAPLSQEVIENIINDIQTTFNFSEIEIKEISTRFSSTFNDSRRQYRGADILKIAKDTINITYADKMLVIFDRDIYFPNRDFIFGIANVAGSAGLISLFRLNPRFIGGANSTLFQERIIKESIHELGHTFGLGHCQTPRCVMNFSSNISGVDAKNKEFCQECKSELAKVAPFSARNLFVTDIVADKGIDEGQHIKKQEELISRIYAFIDNIDRLLFQKLEVAFAKEYRARGDFVICIEASNILARIISKALNLPIGGQSPDRLELISGAILSKDLKIKAIHRWIAIYTNNQKRILIDPTHGQFDSQYKNKILIGDYKLMMEKFCFIEWENLKEMEKERHKFKGYEDQEVEKILSDNWGKLVTYCADPFIPKPLLLWLIKVTPLVEDIRSGKIDNEPDIEENLPLIKRIASEIYQDYSELTNRKTPEIPDENLRILCDIYGKINNILLFCETTDLEYFEENALPRIRSLLSNLDSDVTLTIGFAYSTDNSIKNYLFCLKEEFKGRIELVESVAFPFALTPWANDSFYVLEDKIFTRPSQEVVEKKIVVRPLLEEPFGKFLRDRPMLDSPYWKENGFRVSELSKIIPVSPADLIIGDKYVFVGPKTIRFCSIALFPDKEASVVYGDTQRIIAESLKKAFGDRVIIFMDTSAVYIDLDLWFTYLGENKILLADIKAIEEFEDIKELLKEGFQFHLKRYDYLKERLDSIEESLTSRGFTVKRIPLLPTLYKDGKRIPMQTYNNVLLETFDNKKRVYLPVYKRFAGLNSEAIRIFREEGYEVREIEGLDYLSLEGGSLRCSTKVLERNNGKNSNSYARVRPQQGLKNPQKIMNDGEKEIVERGSDPKAAENKSPNAPTHTKSEDWERDYYRLAETLLKDKARELFDKVDRFIRELNFAEQKEKIRQIASEINNAPFVYEVYGLGYPFYGNVDIRKRIYLSLKELEASRINITKFMDKIMPDIDILLVHLSSQEGPWSVTYGMDPKIMDSFIDEVNLYKPQWANIFAFISEKFQLTKGRIENGAQDPLEEFINEGRLHVDFVPVPTHIWRKISIFIMPDDLRRFRFIRDLLFTTEPLSRKESYLPLNVPLEFRRNYILNLLSSVPLTKNELLVKIIEIHPYRDLIELFPQTRQEVTAKFVKAMELALRENLIFIDKKGKLILTKSGAIFLESILTERKRIIDNLFDSHEFINIVSKQDVNGHKSSARKIERTRDFNKVHFPPKGSIGNVFAILSKQETPLTKQQIAKLADSSVRTIEPDLTALISNLKLVSKNGRGKGATYEIIQKAKENKRQIQITLNKLSAKPTKEQLRKAADEVMKIINSSIPDIAVYRAKAKEKLKLKNSKAVLIHLGHIFISLVVLFTSSYILTLSFMHELDGLVLTFAVFAAGIGVLIGLFYFVENVRRLLERKPARFSFGLGKQIKELTIQERLALSQLADQAYWEERQKIQPSLKSAIRRVFSLKRMALMGLGALIAWSFPGAGYLFILAGAILGLMAPYLISVTYNFFCANIDHYKFRNEFIRKYLENTESQYKLAGEISQVKLSRKFLLPLKSRWNNFTLRFPVVSGIIVFGLGRAQMIFWGSVLASALLPFLNMEIANFSLFELPLAFFNLIQWSWGYEITAKILSIFIQWNIPYTLGDISRLGIIVYGLRMLSLPSQIKRFGFRASPAVLTSWLFAPLAPFICLLIYPILWVLSLGSLKFKECQKIIKENFTGFWVDIFHLSIIGAEIGAVLTGAEILSQHPQLGIIGKPLDSVAKSLEGRFGVIAWGSYMLNSVNQITGVNLSQVIHNGAVAPVSYMINAVNQMTGFVFSPFVDIFIDGRQQDVNIWNKAYGMYRAMKFEPASIGRMEIGEDELEFLLERYKDQEASGIKQFCVYLLGEKSTERAEEILIKALDDKNIDVRKMTAVSLGKIGDYDSVKPLLKNLEVAQSEESFEALMKINDSRATDIFIKGLQSDKEIVRTTSALWLGKTADFRATQPLIEAMNRESVQNLVDKEFIQTNSIEAFFDKKYLEWTPILAETYALGQLNDPDTVNPLIQIASSGKGIGNQQAAIATLGILGDPQAIGPLTKLAHDSSLDIDIRRISVLALGGFNAPEIKDTLYSMLNEDNIDIKLAAASSLVKLGFPPKEFAPEFITIVKNENFERGVAAIQILSKIEAPEVPAVLKSCLENEYAEPKLRIAAAIGLGDLKEPTALKPLIGILENSGISNIDFKESVIYSLGKIGNIEAVPALSQYLSDSENRFRQAAIISLGELKNPAAFEPIKNFLEFPENFNIPHPDFEMSSLAISSLENIDELKAEHALLDIFPKSNNIQFKQAAILGLADSDIPEAGELLFNSLQDDFPEIRYVAVSSLATKISEPKIKDSFINLLKYDSNPFIRNQVALSFNGMEDPGVASALKSALNDPYPQVRATAILSLTPQADFETMEKIKPFLSSPDLNIKQNAILSLGLRANDFPKNVDYLMPLLKDDNLRIRSSTMIALGANIDKFPQVKSSFLDIMNDNSQDISLRQNAIFSLSAIDTPEIEDAFIDNLKHPDWRIRQATALALGDFDDPQIPILLKPLTLDSHWQVKQASAISLGNFDQPQTIDYLKPLLDDDYWQVRQATVDSLGKFDDSKVIDIIIPSLKDENVFVRYSAITNLGLRVNSNQNLIDPLINTLKNDPDSWARQLAGFSLRATKESEVESVRPLIEQAVSDIKVVVMISGVDDYLGFNSQTKRDLSIEDTKNWPLRKIFEAGGVKVIEHPWTGNLLGKDLREAQLSLDKTINYALSIAGGAKIGLIPFSGGNRVAERLFEANLPPNIKAALEEQRIHIISLNSPSKENFGLLDSNWKNIYSP
ncbi:MAG: archaemetzincin family Zn-dependent metalloprotease, partial [Candidatus Omnitrophica bacterium]|nr:archaemetzincin family Zn-dependent metalloprotease [Candidatus Omnitrophota bacterium]